jgi:uncharacterized membrane protein
MAAEPNDRRRAGMTVINPEEYTMSDHSLERQTSRTRKRRRTTEQCQVCKRTLASSEVLPASLVRDNLAALIAAKVPGWSASGFICRHCLNGFRTEFVRAEMEKDLGYLSALEEEVVKSLRGGDIISDDVNKEFERRLTFGERIADKVAEFGGSWRFIFIFFGMMLLWIAFNSLYLLWHPFDPYPYILLNLMLSLVAAIQAPVIMMSQNRQAAHDRLHAENDYKVNLKAEVEIRALGEKLDQLFHHQWVHLLEIQEIQMEMIDDAIERRGHSRSGG